MGSLGIGSELLKKLRSVIPAWVAPVAYVAFCNGSKSPIDAVFEQPASAEASNPDQIDSTLEDLRNSTAIPEANPSTRAAP